MIHKVKSVIFPQKDKQLDKSHPKLILNILQYMIINMIPGFRFQAIQYKIQTILNIPPKMRLSKSYGVYDSLVSNNAY